jgi:acetylornithine deacetylase/succinyl-diaminopimelate desuccinylase-like protein
VAALLTLARTLQAHGLQPQSDLWLVANVGEEGLGNLFGMRAVVERFGDTVHYVVLEGGLFGQVLHRAIAVNRYRIEVRAGGGHSWKNFGRPSAIHELGRIITDIADMKVPQKPWTTFNVGVIEGGTSVNTIAPYAMLQLDLRSESKRYLSQLVRQVEKLVASRAGMRDLQVTLTQIGDRPAGGIPRTAPLVRLAEASLHAVGFRPVTFTTGSTDANIPLSRGYSAVCIGLARANNIHRLDEYLDPEELPRGLGQLLLVALAAPRL